MTQNEVGDFLRLLAHDLQNQMGAVDLNLQIIPTLLNDDDPTLQTIHPFLSRAALAATDLTETLIDLQTFAQLMSTDGASVATTAAPPLTVLNLSSKVHDCGLALASAARNRNVQLQVTPGQNILALGASDCVRRAIKILVTEALRGSFPDSLVTVACLSVPSPTIEISSSQDGLFEEHRVTLAVFLAKKLLESSLVRLDYPSTPSQSTLRLVWKASQL